MKRLLSFVAPFMLAAASLHAGDTLPPLTFEDALKLPPGQAIVLQPATVTRGDTLRLSLTRLGDGSVKPARSKRLVRLMIFERNQTTGAFTSRADTMFDPTVPANAFFSQDFSVSDVSMDANNRGHIIAILIGLKQTATEAPTTGPLPPDLGFTALHLPPSGIGLLLPAVQKVREAAAR